MSGTYRFSWLRPGGWTRLGVAGGVAMVFLTPMMWALGVFGDGPDSLRPALVFLMSALWFFVALGYLIGWSVRGFVVRVKGEGEDEDGEREREPPRSAAAGPHRH